VNTYIAAAILGLIEGLTEFLPVSSTGHLIVFVDLLGFQGPPGKTFEVMIQLGAILALVLLYFRKLWDTLTGLTSNPEARRFALSISVAFLPALILGATLHGFIKSVLFSPTVVAWALIAGGLVIIVVEETQRHVRYFESDKIPLGTSGPSHSKRG
jgi:undecaprenyl-diphosphatase